MTMKPRLVYPVGRTFMRTMVRYLANDPKHGCVSRSLSNGISDGAAAATKFADSDVALGLSQRSGENR